MAISYNRLWKLLIDKNMKKMDLKESVKLSTGTLAKLGKNKPVKVDILERICKELKCDIGDIIEYVEKDNFDFTERGS